MRRAHVIVGTLAMLLATAPSACSSEGPAVATWDAADITANGATLRGYLRGLGTSSSAVVYFAWGTDPSQFHTNRTTPQVMDARGQFSFELAGLSPATKHYFRAEVVYGGVASGAIQSFETLPSPLAVATEAAVNIHGAGGTLQGRLIGLGTSPRAVVSFLWGTTAGGPYPHETRRQEMDGPGPFTADLTGLVSGVTHYFVAKASGYATTHGGEMSFRATATPPKVATHNAENLADTGATLVGSLLAVGTASSVRVSFVWGPTPGGPHPKEAGRVVMSEPGVFTAHLGYLAPGTTYYFRARASGESDAWGDERSFTTETMATFLDQELEVAIRQALDMPEEPVYVSDLASLTRLSINRRNISDLSGLENCGRLRFLDLGRNDLSDLSALVSLTQLTELRIAGGNIGDISPLAPLTNLVVLNLSYNQIEDVSPLASLTKLSRLDISHNEISDISPLTSLTELSVLDTSHNEIEDISPLAPLRNLTGVDLRFNRIGDVLPLLDNIGLSEGDTVDLRGNPLSVESLEVWLPSLVEKGVDVRQ